MKERKILAAKATNTFTSVIVYHRPDSDQFSRTVAIPFRRSPTACKAFALGTDDVGGGQSPSAIFLADFRVRIQDDRVGDFQFFNEVDGVLFAVFDGNREDDKVFVLKF